MEKEIDRLLIILDNNSSGYKIKTLVNENYVSQNIIQKAKNMGYVYFFNEQIKKEVDFIADQYLCRITTDGSRTLNRYGGFEKILKYDRASRYIAMSAFAISFLSLIVTILIAILKS